MKLKELLKEPYFLVHDLIFQKYNSYLSKNVELKNRYNNERCFVLLTGEPVSYYNLGLLENEFVATCGMFFLHDELLSIKPNFNFNLGLGPTIDNIKFNEYEKIFRWPEKYLPSNSVYDCSIIIKALFDKTKTLDDIKYFFNFDSIKYFEKENLFSISNPNVFYIKQMNKFDLTTRTTLDLLNRIRGGGNIFINSILCLIYMGFKEIYILGAGYTYRPNFIFHFYSTFVSQINLGKKLAMTSGQQFVDEYNKVYNQNIKFNGLKIIGEQYRGIYIKERSLDYYENSNYNKLDQFARNIGVKLYNIVPNGFDSPVFETKTWNQISLENPIAQKNNFSEE